MRRPRSVLGSLVYLLALSARRRPGRAAVIAGAAVALALLARGGGERRAARPPGAPQLAVTSAGLAALTVDGDRVQVVETDERGARRRAYTVGIDPEARVVGTKLGTGLVWRHAASRTLRLSTVDARGRERDHGAAAEHVRALCDGAASGDGRWGVGWINDGGQVWFLYGPTPAAAIASAPVEVAAPERGASWCALARTRDGFMLAVRDGGGLALTHCPDARCGWPQQVKGAVVRAEIEAFGCVRKGCVFVTRDRDGAPQATYVTARGRTRWTRALPGAARGGVASAVGVGDDAIAIAYETGDRAQRTAVVTASLDGAIERVWEGAGGAPSVVASRGGVAVARRAGDEVVVEVVAAP